MTAIQDASNMHPTTPLDDPDVEPDLERVRRTVAVMDLVDSVRLMQQHEDCVISRWRRFVKDVATDILPRHGGRLVKSLGDGMLLDFSRVEDAVAASFEMHRRIALLTPTHETGELLCLRGGIHVAEVVVDQLDIYGSGVNLASRLGTLAQPCETVVSLAARDELAVGLDAEIEDLGDCYLKGVELPTRAFRLQAVESRAPAFKILVPVPAPLRSNDLRALVAVIPFDLPGGGADGGQRAIGEWIAEGTIVLLSKLPGVHVVSRMSTSAMSGRSLPLNQVAALLGADYVLSGSVAQSGQMLVLSAELADAHVGDVVWADRIAGSVDDLLAAESQTLAQLVCGVNGAIVEAEVQRSHLQAPPNLKSFSLQISSVAMMHRSSVEDFDRAAVLLRHLVDRHPRLAAPRAWLAMWYVLRVTRGWVDGSNAEAILALDQVRRALDSDPQCSLALAMKGFVECHMLKNLDRAALSLDEAIDANASNSLAWLFKGVVYSLWGRGPEALDMVMEASRLSPLDPLRHYYDALSAPAALAAGQPGRAAEFALRSLRVNGAHSPTWRALVIAQSEAGEIDKASASLRKLLLLDPALTVQSYLARSPAGANDTRKRYANALQRAGLPIH